MGDIKRNLKIGLLTLLGCFLALYLYFLFDDLVLKPGLETKLSSDLAQSEP